MDFGFGAFDIMFGIIPFFVIIMFIAVFILFAVTIAKGVKQKNYNRSQPRLTVRARVVSKRTEVRGHGGSHHHTGDVAHTTGGVTHTSYYATFEVESGDRMELLIPQNEIGYLVEGDAGSLTFRGTEYLGFVRG